MRGGRRIFGFPTGLETEYHQEADRAERDARRR